MKFKSILFVFLLTSFIGCKKESNSKEENTEAPVSRLVGTWIFERGGMDIDDDGELEEFEIEDLSYQLRRTFTKDFTGQDFHDDANGSYLAYDFTWSYIGQDTTSFKFLRYHTASRKPLDSFTHKILVLNDSELVLFQPKSEFLGRDYYFEFKRK